MACSVAARLACSGELLTVVDVNSDDTVAKLRNAIAETARESCSLWLLAQGRLLLDAELLRDSLVREDDKFAVDIVRCEPMPSLAPPPAAPTNLRIFTRCALTGDAFGDLCLWPLDSIATLREAVLRLVDEEGPVQLLLGESCLAGPLSLASAGLRDGATLDVLRCAPRALLTASADGTLRLWDERGGHLGSLPQGEWATSVDAAESLLATGLFDGTVKLWSTSMSFEGLRTLRGHRGPVTSVAFKDSKHLASGSFDRTARLWNVEDGQCLQSFSGHLDGLNFVSWASALLTASVDRTARLWTEEPKVFEHPNEVNSAREHKGCIVTACADHQVRLWDVQTASVTRLLSGFEAAVCRAVFAPSGALVAAVAADGHVALWDLGGDLLWRRRAHGDVATAVEFSQDGQLLVTASSDGTARSWNIESNTSETLFAGHGDAVMDACFLWRSDLEKRPAKRSRP